MFGLPSFWLHASAGRRALHEGHKRVTALIGRGTIDLCGTSLIALRLTGVLAAMQTG